MTMRATERERERKQGVKYTLESNQIEVVPNGRTPSIIRGKYNSPFTRRNGAI